MRNQKKKNPQHLLSSSPRAVRNQKKEEEEGEDREGVVWCYSEWDWKHDSEQPFTRRSKTHSSFCKRTKKKKN